MELLPSLPPTLPTRRDRLSNRGGEWAQSSSASWRRGWVGAMIFIMNYPPLAAIFAPDLKYVTFILVFLGLLVQSFNKLFIVLDFRLNRNYIAQNLCVNRNKPQMHCNGKCHMMKVMKQEQKKDQDNPERKAENKFELICAEYYQTRFNQGITITAINYPRLKETIYSGFSTASFHPPQV